MTLNCLDFLDPWEINFNHHFIFNLIIPLLNDFIEVIYNIVLVYYLMIP